MSRLLAGVLFDLDGTLLDSEKVWEQALADLAAELGGQLSPAARARMVGSSMGTSTAILHDDLGVDGDPETSAAYLTERMAQLFTTELEWKPGAHELLHAVRDAEVPAALVTATHRRLTEIALDFIGRQYFAASVCGDEVGRSKPDPEPYLRAAELLGVEAGSCVAVEDSPTGATSALAAGCAVLAVPSELALTPRPGWTIRPSLVGVGVDELRALVS